MDVKPNPDDTVEISLLKEEVRRLRTKIYDLQLVATPDDIGKPEPSIGRQANYIRKKFEKVLFIAGAGELNHQPREKMTLALQDFEQSLKTWIASPPSQLLMRRHRQGLPNLLIKPNPASISRKTKFATENFSLTSF